VLIDHQTGALTLPTGTIGQDVTRTVFLASPVGAHSRCDDMHNGWMHFYPGVQTLDELVFGVRVVFEGERLDSYSLWLDDPRYGTSWDDYSEEKQLAMRDAHDRWLVAQLGPGERIPSPRGPELHYAFPWGEVWSTFDAKGGSTSTIVRFR
jgi:hypothetical protein